MRGRLLTALAWSAGAFAVIALLSSELARVLGPMLGVIGMSGAALCAAVAGLAFLVVLRVAVRLDARERTEAQVLLGGTTLVSALLVIALATAFAPTGPVELIPLAVLNVAGTAIAALVIAATIPSRRVRGLVLSSIVFGPFLVLTPELWWLGLICALLFVVVVEVMLHHALRMSRAPETALAACLVAGVVVLPVLVLYLGVRFLLRAAARATSASLRTPEGGVSGSSRARPR